MAEDTVTNFLEPTRDILQDVKARVSTLTNLKNIYILSGNKFDELWRRVPAQATPPFACIMYLGSKFQQMPRRSYNFCVIVVYRNVTSSEESQNECMDLIDDIVGVIDHENYNNQVLYKVTSDEWLDYRHPELSVYKINFTAEDY